ncbi:MAG: DNA-directed RNA polymerase subunit A'', partial [Candidatus Thermoplasmatota archaeon]|nr:DNA-directed RNA polymerase subunit A'' [Candidatus Thermoplasmatota archaeon]
IRKETSGEDEYVIYTQGSNLADVFQVPGVDASRVSTNNIVEINNVLGVEAARNSLVNEAMKTLSEQGLSVDYRHIMLVADIMTNDGDIRAIGRHGVSGRKSSVLARAAFEITTSHLLDAGITGEKDRLDGVTENIIIGQPVSVGTGGVKLIYVPKKEEK